MPHRVESAADAAAMIDAAATLNLGSGLLFAVPIPLEAEADGEAVENATAAALAEAEATGLEGRAVTPYVLRRVNELTDGRSLAANIALVENNARVGTEIAVELSKLRSSSQRRLLRSPARHEPCTTSSVVVVGGLVADTVAGPEPGGCALTMGTSSKGNVVRSVGGVGKNVAEAAARVLGFESTTLLTVIGADAQGSALVQECEALGIKVREQRVPECRSAAYVAVHGAEGELLHGVADMAVFEHLEWPRSGSASATELERAALIVCDGNLPSTVLQAAAKFCTGDNRPPLWFEPTSLEKANRAVRAGILGPAVSYISPNAEELLVLAGQDPGLLPALESSEHAADCLDAALTVIADYGVKHTLVSLGEHGILHRAVGSSVEHYPAYPVTEMVNTNGAGDTFVGVCAAALSTGLDLRASITAGLRAASMSIATPSAVADTLSPELL